MKLVCNVFVGNRSVPNQAVMRRKHVKSTLALCKHPNTKEYSFILFNGQVKNGTKYNIKGNIKQVLTKFVNEGKCTIQLNNPPHDLFIQADTIQLKSFLHLFKKALENKLSDKDVTCSSLSVTPVRQKDMAPTKLIILKRSDYPPRGFPRTLEVLYINDIHRASLDRGILQLLRLRTLDLSNNCIEYLPQELSRLPSLKELTLSHNLLGKGRPKQWNWIDGNLAKSLVSLNLSHNELNFVPDQIIKLYKLHSLHVSNNNLTSLPSGIGNLRNLKVFSASDNKISILPGSIKKWKLQNLDLSNNSLQPCSQSLPPSKIPKPLEVCTLKEYAARAVLFAEIPYPPGTVPQTVANYLDHARYCVCGKACFDIYIKHSHMLLLDNIAEVMSTNLGTMVYVPIECYFCSGKCFGTAFHNRNRNPII